MANSTKNPIFCITLNLFVLSSLPFISSLSTISISQLSNQTLVCALIQSSPQKSHLNCTSFPQGIQISNTPFNDSFTSVVGGNGFLCAMGSTKIFTSFMFCWRFLANGKNMRFKRIHYGPVIDDVAAGNSHICGLIHGANSPLHCWQWVEFDSKASITSLMMAPSVAVGDNFVCGIVQSGQIRCLGGDTNVIDHVPDGKYSLVAAGFKHACALLLNGSIDCWGEMSGFIKPSGEFTSLALGENRGCGIRPNGTVVCWGENNFSLPVSLKQASFVNLEAKRDVFCGVLTSNFSLFCWGNDLLESNSPIFDNVVPGPCRQSCPCRPLPKYADYCPQGLMICEPCIQISPSENSPSSPLSGATSESGHWNKEMIAFLIVGCIGSLSFLIVLCFLFYKCCMNTRYRVHDSGPLEEGVVAQSPSGQTSKTKRSGVPVLEKRLSELVFSSKGGKLVEFSLDILLHATNNFSDEQKIGTGSFGSVYRGVLANGSEVAIKRAEISASLRNHYAGSIKRDEEDKDNAFLNELELLCCLNHRNLVTLIGYCDDHNERVLVYEYMNNGNLYDHLHKDQSSHLMSWPARIKVALDAARGIEYLHEYAVPPIIHRDIKSSNILLDATWTAKVSDFGLSLLSPQDDESPLSVFAAGTVGYIDPEYYRLQQLTTKSDVYSFGVVLLELLSGFKAIHRNENGVPRNIVDYIVPYIVQDDIHRVLDRRVAPPTPFEIEAVVYVGYLAADCVNLEGKNRPTMNDIVNSLEKALAACLAPPTLSRSATGSST